MDSGNLILAIISSLFRVVAVLEVHPATPVTVGLDVLSDADVNWHVAHRDGSDCGDWSFCGNTMHASGSCTLHNLGLVESDTNCNSTERYTLDRKSVV